MQGRFSSIKPIITVSTPLLALYNSATLVAISQALGLIAWKQAPPSSVMGCGLLRTSGAAARKIFHESHNR